MQLRKLRLRAGLALVAVVAGLTSFAAVQAPAQAEDLTGKPPAVTGSQSKPDIEAGTKDMVGGASLGPSKLVGVDKDGKLLATETVSTQRTGNTANVGNVANVDFLSPYNYCQGALVYTPVYNSSSTVRYVEVVLYANGVTRTFYATIAAYSTIYPTFYGVTGTYYAYLYVWNGSSYVYDEYKTSANNCSVSVSINYYPGYTGYVLLTIKNNGTAYVSQESVELAPYGYTSTYTGSHWDYPSPGGGTVYRYFYVNTGSSNRFGLFSNNYGANGYSPWRWYGYL